MTGHPFPVGALAKVPLEAMDRVGDLLDGYGNPDNLTAPTVVDTLADKAAIVARFDGLRHPGRDWTTRHVPELGRAWVVRWDRLTIAIPDAGDTLLPFAVADARADVARHLRATVMDLARSLGLDPWQFAKPARPAPEVRHPAA